MSRFTLCIALIASGLLAVGCGSSSDKSSSSSGDAAKPIVTPSGTAASAAAPKATSETKSAKKAATAAAATATASPKAKATLKRQLAQIKAAKAQARRNQKAVAAATPKLSKAHLTATQKQAQTLTQKLRKGGTVSKADLAKLKALQKQVAKEQAAATKKALAGVKLTQPKETGKVGRSKIPGRVASACNRYLRSVDGALNSASKAKALPAALNRTIKQLAVLGSTSSPALSGVTGDVPGLSRTQETLGAMREVVKPAKAYAASPSAAHRAKLAKALKTLKNTAYSDVLNSCAIA